ncbi:uncharacterized protein LOC133292501 isoform X3 [Gastrolobium bilobum]|uniref:uncharacterized protein LOC133292501 isoform X3 n=1 Tax=Gastrolobium bilobum TaxID=150636 RepID=UPI002AAF4BE6|nr:uncharacterized protein LOC133292501 isoform X3 [Gastrolobium bilobum]
MDHSNHVCVLPTSSLSSNREYHEKTMKYLSSFSFSHCSAELPPPRGVMCPLRLRFSYSVSAWVENFSCMQLKARFLTRKIITLSSALSSLYMQKQVWGLFSATILREQPGCEREGTNGDVDALMKYLIWT